MKRIDELYKRFDTQDKFKDIDEMKILESVYSFSKGSIESVMAKVINQAVLNHMNLYIDSTIMQMLALNDYLSQLFLRNLKPLIYNYMLKYLEDKGMEVIPEATEEQIEKGIVSVTMKSNLEDLCSFLETL